MLSNGLNIRLKGNLIKFPKADITLATYDILWLLISTFIVLWSTVRLHFSHFHSYCYQHTQPPRNHIPSFKVWPLAVVFRSAETDQHFFFKQTLLKNKRQEEIILENMNYVTESKFKL